MKRLLLASAFFLIPVARVPAAEHLEKPNIIVIYTDDHGWADLAVQGVEKDLRTPNLDALAAGGLRATDGYVTAPQCVPSRAGLLTGRSQNRFGVENNGDSLDGFDAQTTIATRLQKAGYATGMAGKWHLGAAEKIVDHGFKHSFPMNSQKPPMTNITLDGKDRPMGPLKVNSYHLDACSEVASAFIRRYQEQPFFFYLAYRAPHVPLDAPKKYLDRFPGEMPERRRKALAMISAIDDGVGQVMKTLRDCKLEERTLIVVMGDNGAPLKIFKKDAPGLGAGWNGSLNAPMNGEKGMLSEGGIRVPWLAYWKGMIPAGQVYRQPVISLDVAATATALAGITTKPGELDGVNLLPYFTGEKKTEPHSELYWRWSAQSAIREGNWKLLIAGPRSYLFDLNSDKEEKQNLLERNPDIAKKLRTKLETWSTGLKPPGINTKSLNPTASSYFDYYFDGKKVER